jgi:hypothetical protein
MRDMLDWLELTGAPRGRPRGGSYLGRTRDEAIARYRKVCTAAGRRLGQEEFAFSLGYSDDSAMRRALTRLGLTWADLTAE